MKRKHFLMLGAAAALLASLLPMSSSAMAACSPGYKPVKHSSGNIICVLDVAAGGKKLKLKTK
jgi:hypothetical protein